MSVALEDLETRDVRKEARKDETLDPAMHQIRVSAHLIVRDLSKWRAVVGPLLVKPNLNSFATSFDIVERDQLDRLIGVTGLFRQIAERRSSKS